MATCRRLHEAINAHDLERFAACFHLEYRSEQPAHPRRAFIGRSTVRRHWSRFFAEVPDFQADLLRVASDGDTEWAEWRWHGTLRSGEPFDVRGVTILGVQDAHIVWGRLYMEPVETDSTEHALA